MHPVSGAVMVEMTAPRALVCRVTAAALLTVWALAGTAFAAAPRAVAHPFGEPQVAEIDLDSARNDVVVVNWRFGMDDDLTSLANYFGLVAEDRVMLDGAIFYDPVDSRSLEQSAEFDDYLLQHIRMTTTDGDCRGAVVDKSDVQDTGATVEFTCGSPVKRATVAVTMLTDLHPAYATLASGPSGQKFVYAGDNASHAWSFDSAVSETTGTGLKSSAAVQIALMLGTVALVVVTGMTWHRRRARAVTPTGGG